jgi:hypothetical protein
VLSSALDAADWLHDDGEALSSGWQCVIEDAAHRPLSGRILSAVALRYSEINSTNSGEHAWQNHASG